MKPSASISVAITQYLDCRRKMGFAMKTEGRTLHSLGVYARKVGHRGPLTKKIALQWVQLPASANRLWWARRLDMVRRFARFWKNVQPATEVPPAGLFGPVCHRGPVHLYTPEETSTLLEATDALAQPWRQHTFRTLVGLLTCTGLRISEALRLNGEDLNESAGTLTVRRSKGGRSRCLPLHPSAVQALKAYQRLRGRRHPAASTDRLFLNLRGQPLTYSQAAKTFRWLRRQLPRGNHRAPRWHDMRHSFAVDALLHWYRQGHDVGPKLLALATYLGHRNIKDTYWYLSAVPELLALSSGRLATLTKGGRHV